MSGNGPITTRYFQGTDGNYYKIEITQEQKQKLANVRSNQDLSVFLQAANNKVQIDKNDIPTGAEEIQIEGETVYTQQEVTKDWRRPQEKIDAAKERVDKSVYFTPDQKAEFEAQKAALEEKGQRPVLLTKQDMETLKEYGLYEGIVEEQQDGKKTIDSDKLKELSQAVVGNDYILDTKERKAGFFQLNAQRKERNLFKHLGYDVQFKKAVYAAPAGAGLILAGASVLGIPNTQLRTILSEKLHLSDNMVNALITEVEDHNHSETGMHGMVTHDEKSGLMKWIGRGLIGLGTVLGIGGFWLDKSMNKENEIKPEAKEGFTYYETNDNNCPPPDNNTQVVTPPVASVEHEEDKTVTNPNTAYKMQKGDTLANVIKAKYGITDPKDLRAAIKEIRRATGIPENGYQNGQTAIPHIEVDGKVLRDAYWLPDKILDGKYNLDNTKNANPINYPKRGVAVQGKSATTTQTQDGQWVTKDPDGKELYRGVDEATARRTKDDYDAAQRKKAEEQNKSS